MKNTTKKASKATKAPMAAPKKAIAKKAVTMKTKNPAKANGKGAAILALIQRDGGATAAELQQATGWQSHSVRGFLSGVVGKKMGLNLASARREDGERVYSLEA
jgi:Protein of unknown function (DUF3489)